MVDVSGAPLSPNTTGTPNPDDYLLGRGELFYSELDADDEPADSATDGGFLHLGNCPQLELVPSSEFLEHYSSMQGLKSLDYKLVIQQKFDVNFQLEEANEANAALFFSATPEAVTNAAVAGFTEQEIIDAVHKGRWYRIIDPTTGNRAWGIAAADLTLEKQGAPDTPLVIDVDYTLDEARGLVKFLTTGVVLADGDDVDATLAANPLADSTRRIPVQSRSSVTVALLFYGINPKTARQYELLIPKITLAANNPFGLISADSLTSMSFSGSAEKKDSTTAIAYITPLPIGGVT